MRTFSVLIDEEVVNMDDIVKLLWNRDEEALHKMERQYSGFCHSIIIRFISNLQDTEEILNDIWLQIWNAIPPERPRYFKAYLAKIARNTALHYIEREQAQKRSGITVLIDELSECIPDKKSSMNLESYHIREVLNRFVQSLHGDERSFFVKRYYFGKSIGEIANEHHRTENSVTVSLCRIRKKLRVLLEKEDVII